MGIKGDEHTKMLTRKTQMKMGKNRGSLPLLVSDNRYRSTFLFSLLTTMLRDALLMILLTLLYASFPSWLFLNEYIINFLIITLTLVLQSWEIFLIYAPTSQSTRLNG